MIQRTDRTGEELDGRARDVLREIVMQYVSSGEPISSRSLAKSGRFVLSPASLRNVMADLEDLGYLHQPHTSAGRVPTDRGYRFFINHLMKSRRLSSHEREAIDGQVAQVSEIDQVMHLASRLISRLTDQVGIVFVPTLQHLTMRSVTLIPVADFRVMVVVVGSNSVVMNKVIETRDSFTAEELEGISRYLTAEFSGRSLSSVHEMLTSRLNEERAQYDATLQKAIKIGIDAVGEVRPSDHDLFVEGAASILNKPEFSDAEAIRKTMVAFEQKERLLELLNRCFAEPGVQILVGSESRFTESYNFSLVATRYGSAASPIGLVGIIGPTRMEYARMATIVDYLGQALSRKIQETTGADS
jgi:heat-inducible transcriptional repressor